RLRYAAARALHRPKAKRQPAFWAGKEQCSLLGGYAAPKPPLLAAGDKRTLCCKPDISLANKTGQLDVLQTRGGTKRPSAPSGGTKLCQRSENFRFCQVKTSGFTW